MIYYRKNLNKLVYEDINDEYGYGKYENFEVVIRKIDGYINVSKLCKDGNKNYFNWKKSHHATISIQSVQTYHNIQEEKVLELVHEGRHFKINGTYAHPALVPHIASWVSVDFFNMVSDVVNNHIVNKYEEELKEKEYQLRKKEETIKEKDDEISRLLKEIKENTDKAINELKVANENIVDLKTDVKVANENIVELKTDVNVAVETIKFVAQQRVPLERMPDPEEELLIIFYTDEKEEKPYRFTRRQRRSLSTFTKNLRNQYPDLREVIRFRNQPNPVESWNACKRTLTENMEWTKNNFRLVGISEERFKERVNEIVEIVRMEPYEEVKERVLQDQEQVQQTTENRDERRRELSMMTITKLKDICKERNLKKYHKMKKSDLIGFIIDNE